MSLLVALTIKAFTAFRFRVWILNSIHRHERAFVYFCVRSSKISFEKTKSQWVQEMIFAGEKATTPNVKNIYHEKAARFSMPFYR